MILLLESHQHHTAQKNYNKLLLTANLQMTENFVCSDEYPHNSTPFVVLLHMDWALMQNTLAASLSPSHSSSLLKRTFYNKHGETEVLSTG